MVVQENFGKALKKVAGQSHWIGSSGREWSLLFETNVLPNRFREFFQ
jgi:hypothetical protein